MNVEQGNPNMDTFPPLVQSALAKMTEDQKLTFQAEYDRQKKSLGLMIPVTLLFIHFFFYRRFLLGFIFILTAGGSLIWWAIELFLIGKRLGAHNRKVATEVVREMKLMGG